MMNHLFEDEIRSISSFNSVALTPLSFATLFANCIIAMVIGWGFATDVPTEFAKSMLHKGVYFVAVLMVMCFGFGIWAIRQKRSNLVKVRPLRRKKM